MASWTRRNCSVRRQVTAARTARVGRKVELAPMAIGLQKVVRAKTVKGDRTLAVLAIVRHVPRPKIVRNHAAMRNRAVKETNHAANGSRATTTKKPKRHSGAEPRR